MSTNRRERMLTIGRVLGVSGTEEAVMARAIVTLQCALFALAGLGCGEQKLTDGRALDLLRAEIREANRGQLSVDASMVVPLFGPLQYEDIQATMPNETSEKGLLRKLISLDAVRREVEPEELPDLTGDYEGTCGFADHHYLLQFGKITAHISMRQGSPNVSGEFLFEPGRDEYGRAQGGRCTVAFKSGRIVDSKNQIVEISVGGTGMGCCVSTYRTYTFAITGIDKKFSLSDVDRSQNTGHNPIDMKSVTSLNEEAIKVNRYRYVPTEKFSSLFDEKAQSVAGGQIQVDSMDGLLLSDGGAGATASFRWHVDLNQVAVVLLGNRPGKNGNGSVAFGKKPDGTWVVKTFRL
jgi:hypothetical protein